MLNRLAAFAALLALRRKTIIAAAALMTLPPMECAAAQTASPQINSLTCNGTVQISDSRQSEGFTERVKNMGIVINLANGTVSAGFFADVAVVHIIKADDANIEFHGDNDQDVRRPATKKVLGSINRVTGNARFSVDRLYDKTSFGEPLSPPFSIGQNYDLTCKATNR